ncbi:helix-turn-helix domain-containing protein [Tropicibacter sp. R15_0]|uniref:helix-turn-helix domain-containing protein n=1 Tax=Tropicibacter sp. R15_0 TaxID=2821101 RepID=UPI001AD971C3|nr:helix-turn-helix domain-containing protein [Tropicibacter sp. R15_0]MBO9464745.1 helix-turn-helix domain-containing protein [Tropicibacter sp. R15_0]
MSNFGQELKTWRTTRRLSQLALATDSGISARHLSFLETGRARPSRGMILRLTDCLNIPRPARNHMLVAAGFAPAYPEIKRDAEMLAPFSQAIDRMLEKHAPYPASVMDREWCILQMNAPAQLLFGGVGLQVGQSLIDILLETNIGPEVVENWPEFGHHILMRLRAESAEAGGLASLDKAAQILADDPAIASYEPPIPLPAVTPTRFRAGPTTLSLFSTFAQFGSAEEVTLSDLKIELLFPCDEATRLFLEQLG